MLPGGTWQSVEEARLWLQQQRDRLGWAPRDAVNAIRRVTMESDLWMGTGGGERFQGPTVRSITQFEAGKATTKINRDESSIVRFDLDPPDWLFWVPLAIERLSIAPDVVYAWERSNIPGHRASREEQEFEGVWTEDSATDDLINRLNSLNPDDQDYIFGLILEPVRISQLRTLVFTLSEMARAKHNGGVES